MRDDDAWWLLALVIGGYAMSTTHALPWGIGWLWPVPPIQTADGHIYEPVISDGWGSPRPDGRIHRGADIMFRRRARGDRPEYAPRTKDGSPLFFAPGGIPVVAARAGHIWSAGKTARGNTLVIDHGKPWATYYTHLESLAVAQHADGKSLVTGKPTAVHAGQVIGTMGADPSDAGNLRHLHFAPWYNGHGEAAAVDAQSEMERAWAKLQPHRV